MDHNVNKSKGQGLLSDAPAYWFNTATPCMPQDGSDRNNISCPWWSTGAGKFYAFKVLNEGAERAHSAICGQSMEEGGDSNWFRRPVGRTMKFAVMWHYPHVTALILDDRFEFSEQMAGDTIQKLVAYGTDSCTHSLYAIGD
jgi:hypothetical protein